MDLSEYERRQSEPQLLLLPSRSATRASTKSPAQSSASTSKNDNGAVCLRKDGREPGMSLKLLLDQFG
jgi:hypothetical protein